MPDGSKGVTVGEIIQAFNLEVLCGGQNYEQTPVRTMNVNRPGLPMTGFFECFDSERIQIIGLTEATYLRSLSPDVRAQRFEALISYPIPAVIITRGLEVYPEGLEPARKNGVTILRTQEETSNFSSLLVAFLYDRLAPRITRSGVMLEVYGEGVLVQGESGVGKSEVAIELIKRGHRLIADDAVEIRRTNHGTLDATAPELIRQYMELRGIGVIDVRQLFGMQSIKLRQKINLVINLEPWDDQAVYDRLGLETAQTELLGVTLPYVTLPVKPGRNLASIIEVAVMNNRNRLMGHNAALELTQRMDEYFKRQM